MGDVIVENITAVMNETATTTKPGPFDAVFQFLTSPLGMFLIIIIIGVLIIYLLYKRLSKARTFEFITFARIIDEDLKKKFELKGLEVNGTLTQGFEFLGKVNKIIHEKARLDILYYNPKDDRFVIPTKRPDCPKTRIYDIYMFRLDQKGFILIRLIRNLLGIPKHPYVIVDTKHIENFGGPRAHMWNLKTQIAFQRFGEVFITSEMSKDYLSDLATKYAHESELTYLANYPNKAVYLEMEHAKAMNKYRTKKDIDTKAYKEYKKGNEDVKEDDKDDD
jgi:hypothetical protein